MIIRDTLGNQYTIEQFNQLEAMPVGAELLNLKASGKSELTKLPKNLVVLDQLWLNGTQVKEVPSDLKAEQLVLCGSEVETVPDNLTVGTLNLNNSKVKAIGKNVIATRSLYLDATEMLSQQITCKSCIISRIDGPGVFDLSQVIMEELIIEGKNYDIEVRNATAKKCVLSSSTIVIDNSTFEEIILHDVKAGRKTPARLRLQSGVTSNNLLIKESETVIDIEINQSKINTVQLYGQQYSNIKITELVLYGDLVVGRYGSFTTPDILPRLGVIYGDLYIYKEYELPEKLCCTGKLFTN